MLTTLLQDLRYSARLMSRARGFTSAALLTLALAIGANTAVFSVVYGVLLRPLPYPGADRIVRLSEEHPGGQAIVRQAMLSHLTFDAWSASPQTVEALAAYTTQTVTVTSFTEPVRIETGSVSPSLFQMLGVTPMLGRTFRTGESAAGADRVALLSHRLWQSRFGSDPAIVGTPVSLNGQTYEIVGVLPGWFYFPDRDAALWTPFVPEPGRPDGVRLLYVIARLTPGATVEQAAAEGTAAARSVKRPMAADLLFGKGGPVEVRARLLTDEITRGVRPAMRVLMMAVALVLLIACANVANLLLARGAARGREMAVRAALGAGAARLARQLLTESVTLSLAGGALGVLLAWMLTRAAPSWAPEGFPRIDDVRLDWRVLGFGVLISIAAGAIAGLFPVWRAARTDLTASLRSDDNRSVGAGERVRGALLAIEAALSVVLLIGAALLVRSFVALINVDAGYDPANVLTARVYVSGAASTGERRAELVRRIVDRLRAVPQVAVAGVGNMIPLGESSFVSGFSFGTNAAGESVVARALQYVVTDGYAEALGLKLREGRFLQASDATSPVQAMLVNDAFARAYMTDGKPIIGRRYKGLVSDDQVTTEIVGVIGNVLKDGLDTAPQSEIYLAHGRGGLIRREINVVVRTSRRPECRRADPAIDRARPRAHRRRRACRYARESGGVVGERAATRDGAARLVRGHRARAGRNRTLRCAVLQRLAAAPRDRHSNRARRHARRRRAPGADSGPEGHVRRARDRGRGVASGHEGPPTVAVRRQGDRSAIVRADASRAARGRARRLRASRAAGSGDGSGDDTARRVSAPAHECRTKLKALRIQGCRLIRAIMHP